MKVISRMFKIALALGAIGTLLGLAPTPASAQLFGRRTVVVQSPTYVVPGAVVPTTYVAPAPAVVSTTVPAAYSQTVVTSAPVPATYTTATTVASPVVPTAYAAPAVVAPVRPYRVVVPRRVYRYYYYPY